MIGVSCPLLLRMRLLCLLHKKTQPLSGFLFVLCLKIGNYIGTDSLLAYIGVNREQIYWFQWSYTAITVVTKTESPVMTPRSMHRGWQGWGRTVSLAAFPLDHNGCFSGPGSSPPALQSAGWEGNKSCNVLYFYSPHSVVKILPHIKIPRQLQAAGTLSLALLSCVDSAGLIGIRSSVYILNQYCKQIWLNTQRKQPYWVRRGYSHVVTFQSRVRWETEWW